LEDPFEGSFTEGSIRAHQEEWDTSFPDDLVTLARWVPCQSYVSCWHISDVESAALWRVYGDAEGSLAIRSTVGALKTVFPEKLDVADNAIISQDIRKVLYIDYTSDHPHLNDLAGPLCYKRHAFAYEQELRLIRQELPTGPASGRANGRAIQLGPPPPDKGRVIRVEPDTLLKAIYLAPSSPEWIRSLLQKVLARFGLGGLPCRQSGLDDLPEIAPF